MDASSSKISGPKELYKNGTYDRMAALKIIDEYKYSRCTRISVEGYDSSLPKSDIRTALKSLFSPCGQMFDIMLPGDPGLFDVAEGSAFIFFMVNGAQQKAVALDGTHVGGRKLVVKPLPKLPSRYTHEEALAMRQADFRFTSSNAFFVSGYDTALPAKDIKSALIKHFSSCGDITDLFIHNDCSRTNVLKRSGVLSIYGEGSVEKVLALNGTDVGGWKVLVVAFPGQETEYTPEPSCLYFGPVEVFPVPERKHTPERSCLGIGYTAPECSMKTTEITSE